MSAEHQKIAARAREVIARADEAMQKVRVSPPDQAVQILVKLGDEFDAFNRRELTVVVAFESDELAKLHDELRKRMVAAHERWTALAPAMN